VGGGERACRRAGVPACLFFVRACAGPACVHAACVRACVRAVAPDLLSHPRADQRRPAPTRADPRAAIQEGRTDGEKDGRTQGPLSSTAPCRTMRCCACARRAASASACGARNAPRQRARPAPPDCGRAGILEGQNLGLEKGRELGHELGFYAGCAECWCASVGGSVRAAWVFTLYLSPLSPRPASFLLTPPLPLISPSYLSLLSLSLSLSLALSSVLSRSLACSRSRSRSRAPLSSYCRPLVSLSLPPSLRLNRYRESAQVSTSNNARCVFGVYM